MKMIISFRSPMQDTVILAEKKSISKLQKSALFSLKITYMQCSTSHRECVLEVNTDIVEI